MLDTQISPLNRIGQLEHQVQSIRLALAATALRDDVRLVLVEHLDLAEQALILAKGATQRSEEEARHSTN